MSIRKSNQKIPRFRELWLNKPTNQEESLEGQQGNSDTANCNLVGLASKPSISKMIWTTYEVLKYYKLSGKDKIKLWLPADKAILKEDLKEFLLKAKEDGYYKEVNVDWIILELKL
jgi:hypothetical protein